MGGEFAQDHEWRHDYSLDWHENKGSNEGIQKLLKDLNELYRHEPALYEYNFSYEGFEWVDHQDSMNSVLAWLRKGRNEDEILIFVGNFTPMCRHNYRIGVPKRGYYTELFNSDDHKYNGSNCLNYPELETTPIPKHGRTHSLSLTLPPLGVTVLKFLRPHQARP